MTATATGGSNPLATFAPITNSADAPTVTTPTSASITSTTATLGGDVTANGGVNLIKRGVLYSATATNNNPTLGGTGVTEIDDGATTTGVFTESATGLSIVTGYSFVAFATNSVGTTYTTPVSTFTTLGVAPTVTTPTSASITPTTATLGGDVTANGGVNLIKRGVLYSATATNNNPTLGGTGVTEIDDAATTTGVFAESATGSPAAPAIHSWPSPPTVSARRIPRQSRPSQRWESPRRSPRRRPPRSRPPRPRSAAM